MTKAKVMLSETTAANFNNLMKVTYIHTEKMRLKP